MNRKQFAVLLLVVVLVGVAGWIVHQRGNNSWQGAGQAIGGKLLPNLPVNDVAQITIQSGTNELTLAMRDNFWRVRERGYYPANFPQISDLLLKFADLKIIQSQEIGPSQLGRFQLLPPGTATNTGTLIEFKDQSGKSLASVLLGKTHMNQPAGGSQFDGGEPDGRYVMTGGDAKTVAVISDPLDNVQPGPKDWLDKTFFKIEKPRSIAVSYAVATNSWKLTRASETNDWQLADAAPGEKLDTSKLDDVTSPFSSQSFDDVSPGATAFKNATTVNVETFDGFAYNAAIGPELDGEYPVTFSVSADLPVARTPAKNEAADEKAKLDTDFKNKQKTLQDKLAKEKQFENWTFQISEYTVNSLLKPRSQLLIVTKASGTNAPVSTETN
jgi:hypothetical protein